MSQSGDRRRTGMDAVHEEYQALFGPSATAGQWPLPSRVRAATAASMAVQTALQQQEIGADDSEVILRPQSSREERFQQLMAKHVGRIEAEMTSFMAEVRSDDDTEGASQPLRAATPSRVAGTISEHAEGSGGPTVRPYIRTGAPRAQQLAQATTMVQQHEQQPSGTATQEAVQVPVIGTPFQSVGDRLME